MTFEANHTDRHGRVFPVECAPASLHRRMANRELLPWRWISLSAGRPKRHGLPTTRLLRRIGDTLPNGALVSFRTGPEFVLILDHVSAGFWAHAGLCRGRSPGRLITRDCQAVPETTRHAQRSLRRSADITIRRSMSGSTFPTFDGSIRGCMRASVCRPRE